MIDPDNFPFNTVSNFTNTTVSHPEAERQSFLQQGVIPPISSFSSSANSYPITNPGVLDANSLISGSSLRSSFKVGHNVTIATNPATTIQIPPTLTIESNLETIAYAMARPNSGLDVHDRMWLKIRIPNAFIGSDVVDWLYSEVQGLHERKEAKKFASKLLKANFIRHTINLKSSFSEKCYYVFSEQLQQLNKSGDFNSPEFNLPATQQAKGFLIQFFFKPKSLKLILYRLHTSRL